MLLPLLIVLPLTVVLLYFGVSRGLQPLKSLAVQIDRRSPGLFSPVEPDNVPEEVQGVVAALNDLLQRLALALHGVKKEELERGFQVLAPQSAPVTRLLDLRVDLSDDPLRDYKIDQKKPTGTLQNPKGRL